MKKQTWNVEPGTCPLDEVNVGERWKPFTYEERMALRLALIRHSGLGEGMPGAREAKALLDDMLPPVVEA